MGGAESQTCVSGEGTNIITTLDHVCTVQRMPLMSAGTRGLRLHLFQSEWCVLLPGMPECIIPQRLNRRTGENWEFLPHERIAFLDKEVFRHVFVMRPVQTQQGKQSLSRRMNK
jgi:hypothetical protein